MKTLKFLIIAFAVSILILVAACKKNIKGPEVNLSSASSIQLGTASSGTPYYTLDNTGKYLFLFVRDLNYNNGLVQKINLSGSIPILEKTITVLGSVPISPDNVVVTDDNQFIGTFFNFAKSSMLIYKFDADLNITKIDTVAKVSGGNFGRTRLVKNGKGKITGVLSNKSKGKCYLTYKNMDENLNVLNQITDTSSFYGASNIAGTGLIKTSDGSYLYTADNVDTLYFNNETVLEKRDANFKLLWRVKYKPTVTTEGASPSTLNEYNGKYYVYCGNTIQPPSTFALVFDLNGNLLQKTPFTVDGLVFKTGVTASPMRMTESGEFLVLNATKLNTDPNLQRGIMFHTDANLNVLSSKVFGGKGVVPGLIKINANKYLLFYLDFNFAADNYLPRLVLQYVDAKGNFIN